MRNSTSWVEFIKRKQVQQLLVAKPEHTMVDRIGKTEISVSVRSFEHVRGVNQCGTTMGRNECDLPVIQWVATSASKTELGDTQSRRGPTVRHQSPTLFR